MGRNIIDILRKNKSGNGGGVYSVCSANRYVLEASMLQAQKDNSLLLIEATSNQVDQFGGYTGMTPVQFRDYVYDIAVKMGFKQDDIVLGGDHLGPNVWQNLSADEAMANARVQIEAYAAAGFKKIHLDTSMPLGDDPVPLDVALSAERAAELCKAAEDTYKNENGKGDPPIYVVGTEVPIPGGAHEKLDGVAPTPIEEVRQTLDVTKSAFEKIGLSDVWERVVAVVVQPGVEFSDDSVVDYSREKASGLSAFIEDVPLIVFEAHSTDYQPKEALAELVEDHFAILKVGPWLTYALREAVFALAIMEKEWLGHRKDIELSNIIEVLEREMLAKPEYWQKHYHGDDAHLALSRRYSYSDRIRYYWTNKSVENSLDKLIDNLTRFPVSESLISQYLPQQYYAVRNEGLNSNPVSLIYHKIMKVLELYSEAVKSDIG
jgi:D-tagatose-1,6-bisphosphate aldolase subunit GatZ/KbaZ